MKKRIKMFERTLPIGSIVSLHGAEKKRKRNIKKM